MRRVSHNHDFVFEDVHLAEVSFGDLVNSEFINILAIDMDALSFLVKCIEFLSIVIIEAFLGEVLPCAILELNADLAFVLDFLIFDVVYEMVVGTGFGVE